jgi:hypothetical protein
MEHFGSMDTQDSPRLAVRLTALAFLYGLALVGLFAALNHLVH